MLEISETFSFENSRLYAEKLDLKYSFLSCEVIGRTHHSRGIFSFSVGNPKDSVLIVGGTGGKSSQTSAALYLFLDRICKSICSGAEISGINYSALIKKFGITVIPCLNPDSVQIALGLEKPPFPAEADNWNANGAGVNIDMNFDSAWREGKMLSLEKKILFAAPDGFPGNFRESEPETKAFTALCRRRRFRSCLTLLSGDDAVFYNHGENTAVPSAMMAKILSSSCCLPVSQEEMPPCPSRWFIDKFHKPGFLLSCKNRKTASELFCVLEEALVLMSVM